MANTMFGTSEELLRHLVTTLPPGRAKAAELYESFREFGYVARQEFIGITVMPKMLGANVWVTLGEGSADAPGHTQVVMLSSPAFTDDEYDSWVEIVQAWSAGLNVQTKAAFSRMIRDLKKVEDGIPLPKLHKEMPASLLFSYRRRGDFVIVIDPPAAGKRKIYTTKNIG
jgi:hypothetical protein